MEGQAGKNLQHCERTTERFGEVAGNKGTWEELGCAGDQLSSCHRRAAGNVDSKGCADASSTGNQGKGQPCYNITKKLSLLCLCPVSPRNTGLQDDELVYLTKEISKEQSIQPMP